MSFISNKRFQFYTSGSAYGHCFFLNNEGKLFSFGIRFFLLSLTKQGDNEHGHLSLKDKKDRYKPEEVVQFARKVHIVACGYEHTLIATIDNEVYASGSNEYGQLSLNTDKKEIDDIPDLDDLGGLFGEVSIPKIVKDLSQIKILEMFCGLYHSLFIVENGFKVLAVGFNDEGQLGCNDSITRSRVVEMKIKKGIKFETGVAGYHFTALLSKSKEIYKTGRINQEGTGNGDLKNKYYVPVLINPKGVKFRRICAGGCRLIALSESRKVFVLGAGVNRGYGVEKKIVFPKGTKNYLCALNLPQTSSFVEDVNCGSSHICFLNNDGSAWGIGEQDYLGQKHKESNEYQMYLLKKNIVQIQCGRFSTFLFEENGKVWCAGENLYGQLGLGHRKHNRETMSQNIYIKNLMVKRISTFISRWIYSPLQSEEYNDVIIFLKQ